MKASFVLDVSFPDEAFLMRELGDLGKGSFICTSCFYSLLFLMNLTIFKQECGES